MRLDYLLTFIFFIYASVVIFPVEYIGYIDSIIRLATLIFIFSFSIFKNIFFLYCLLFSIISIFIGNDFVQTVLTLFDFSITAILIEYIIRKKDDYISINFLRLVSLFFIFYITSVQFLNLPDLYYPYSEIFTVGAFRNKAIYSICFILFYYIWYDNREKRYIDMILIFLLSVIIVLSFRRTAWIILLISLIQLLNFKSLRSLIIPSIILLIPGLLFFDVFIDSVFKIAEARSTNYLFEIDQNQWRFQEYLIHLNDINYNQTDLFFGNLFNDIDGSNFWSRFGVDNTIHVDLIRLAHNLGYIGFILFLGIVFNFFKKLKNIKNMRLYIGIYLIIFFLSGGVVVHVFNTVVFFIIISSMKNYCEKNINPNI